MYYKNNMGLRLEPLGMLNVLNESLDLQSFNGMHGGYLICYD